jgi:hypothetical protein
MQLIVFPLRNEWRQYNSTAIQLWTGHSHCLRTLSICSKYSYILVMGPKIQPYLASIDEYWLSPLQQTHWNLSVDYNMQSIWVLLLNLKSKLVPVFVTEHCLSFQRSVQATHGVMALPFVVGLNKAMRENGNIVTWLPTKWIYKKRKHREHS